MEPIKNPIEIPSQNPETPNAEVPRSPERESTNPVQEVQNEVAKKDDTLVAETEALKQDMSEAIAIPETEPKLVNHEISTAEDELLSQLNKAK